jgi:RimJ/RimL family protein N-acetyltransferase
MYFLESPRLGLRRFGPSDSAFVVELWNDPAYLEHIGDRGVRTEADALRYLAEKLMPSCTEEGVGPYLVEKAGTRDRMGFVGFFKRPAFEGVDIGFAFLPAFRGKGYAHESAQLLEAFGRTVLKLQRLNGFTSTTNEASARILIQLGLVYQRTFHMEGYEGDTNQYSKTYTDTA